MKKYMNFLKNDLYLEKFYRNCNKLSIFLIIICFLFLLLGLIFCLFVIPIDYQQHEIFKIMYIHVPSAFMSIVVYCVMSFFSLFHFIYNIKIFDILANESGKIGALFTFLALITGSLWAKPMWGTWWINDARLISELILFFIYISYLYLRISLNNIILIEKYCAILNIIGILNIPIIHFSVKWWYTLHQGYTVKYFLNTSNYQIIYYPLFFLIFILFLFYIAVILFTSCTHILEYEKNKNWVFKELLKL